MTMAQPSSLVPTWLSWLTSRLHTRYSVAARQDWKKLIALEGAGARARGGGRGVGTGVWAGLGLGDYALLAERRSILIHGSRPSCVLASGPCS